MSHSFQMIGHLNDVLAKSFIGAIKAYRIKLTINDDTEYDVNSSDRIQTVISRIKPVDGLYHMTMVVKDAVPVVYPENPFDFRRMWDNTK